MKLYEINEAILAILDRMGVDPETGEVIEEDGDQSEETWAELSALQMEKNRILEYLAKEVLNTRADQDALKTEEERLKAKRSAKEKREERLMHILDRECDGVKTDLGVATVAYRRSEVLDVQDTNEAIQWLKDHDLERCIKIADPEVRKDEVKRLWKGGKQVPGTALVEKRNCLLK